MYLLSYSLGNIKRYKNRYILSGILLCCITFICASMLNLNLIYMQITENINSLLSIQELPLSEQLELLSVKSLAQNRAEMYRALPMLFYLVGFAVLYLLVVINIRERKHGIGVLRTMGMSKSMLSLSFFYEIAFFIMTGLAVGLLSTRLWGAVFVLRIDSGLQAFEPYIQAMMCIDLRRMFFIFGLAVVSAVFVMLSFIIYVSRLSVIILLQSER